MSWGPDASAPGSVRAAHALQAVADIHLHGFSMLMADSIRVPLGVFPSSGCLGDREK